MRRNGKTARETFAFMRHHAGEKFLPSTVAATLQLPAEAVNHALARQFVDGRYVKTHLHRELDPASAVGRRKIYHYWIEVPKEEDGDEAAGKVRRYMTRNPRAARPSEISKATALDVRAVLRVLNQWSACGQVVRCELLTRAGSDRYEYRLAAASARLFTSIRERGADRAVTV